MMVKLVVTKIDRNKKCYIRKEKRIKHILNEIVVQLKY